MTSNTALTPGQVTHIPIGKLVADPDQPRKHFDEASLKQLGESMAKRVLVPLLVRPGARGKLTIVDGERRWRAAKLAGLQVLPVLLAGDDISDGDRALDQVAVNQLREHLKPMEVARLLAGLRATRFATDNDLAAALDKRGLPAMTPKQIAEAIELTELPDWTQAMIDAGGLEASAAAKIRVLLRWPKLLKAVEKDVGRRINWSGRADGNDVVGAIRQALRDEGKDLSCTEEWNAGSSDAVHFNPKTACKGCEHLATIDGHRFCMNPPDFEKKNAEAKAAGLRPGGKQPQKTKAGAPLEPEAGEVKAAARAQTLEEKARDYLHAYLVRHIAEALRGGDIDIAAELLIWRAMERPGQHSWGGRAAVLKRDAAEAAGVKSLEWLFTSKDLDDARREAAIEVVTELKWRETQVICHELWGPAIEQVWSLDEMFTNLFRKAELVHLAVTYKLDLPEKRKSWEACKASELKDALCEQADKLTRPAMLRDIYEKVDAPYVRLGGWPGDDDDEDLEEDGND